MSVGGALQGVFLLITLVGLGAILTRTGALGSQTEEQLSKLAVNLFIPCNMFFNCLQSVDMELLRGAGFLLPLPFFVMLAGYGLGALFCRIFRVKESSRGLVTAMFSLSNAVFIGLPVCTAIFGDKALPLITIYFFSNTLLFWTFGAAGIARDGGHRYPLGWRAVARVFSPPLVGSLLGAAVGLLGIPLPQFLLNSLNYVGGMNIPVSLFITGAVVSRMGRGALRIGREAAVTILGRFFVLPLLTLGACFLFFRFVPGITLNRELVTGVFVAESAMPTMSQAMLMARHYNSNQDLAAQMLALTTLLSVLFIPILVGLLGLVIPLG